ncbi:hypothetical protein E6P09_14605 [Haloferax mediterranei ATCC 33500]|uniref:DUF8106 domain-containing protein n=1 Tax=Haloferax mediterranei (strain ATCC 33500 / DSM 1411 / JCM 8866 / NBRC 14739 / NCIMB 2177 / R-4) TaxID=523841 RepID=I3R7B3_HALMT|nr:hypothetical protein [Haloferax mediterranei]AFK20123.1 hypothetical protein HFX_2438 [Haloferax mediterranei ATCC 33500]AHZ23495.1 hypothetical protein BM92_12975 [Haloferax mediterranei ATCC 33500]ELZ99669.1 hypothetical protein C439_13984 [Haloferax mediterranei ATCC 33500]MDX5987127.1 hypothetical protein [Haloferax mediterranei ATCC 33500]QCQ76440.1 hypothetical protein E6P09_14605 [Haloferax mediterranei ATCC 33500]
MNDVIRNFSSEPPDFERRKAILFCQTCGRAAHIDEWPVQTTDDHTRRIDCPDCGEVVWNGLESDEAEAADRLPTPTA